MAYNFNLVQTEEVVFTSTSLVLGYGSGQTVPPRYLVCEPTGNMTITLPLSTPTLPSTTTTQTNYIPGAGPGYPITIFNAGSSGYTVTLVAASGDTLNNIPIITNQYSSFSVFASPTENCWYGFGQSSAATGGTGSIIVSAENLGATSTSFTLFTADQAYQVTQANVVFATASSSGTMNIEKATGTTAVGSGTALLTATMSLAGTANTVVNGTLIATTATLTLATGNRVNVLLAGTLTSLADCTVTVGLRRLI